MQLCTTMFTKFHGSVTQRSRRNARANCGYKPTEGGSRCFRVRSPLRRIFKAGQRHLRRESVSPSRGKPPLNPSFFLSTLTSSHHVVFRLDIELPIISIPEILSSPGTRLDH